MSGYRRPSVFWPLVLIAIGALLLLENLGMLPTGLWPALIQLWPVTFILLGLDMLIGRRSSAAVAFVVVAGALIVAGALLWAALRAQHMPTGDVQPLIQSAQGAERLEVALEFSAGELRVGALGASDHVMEGTARNGPGETAAQDYRVRGGIGRLRLRQVTDPLLLPFLAARSVTAAWEVNLSGELPLGLDVTTGAGSTTLDLEGLRLERLTLRAGVGQTRVIFPSEAAEAEVTTGVGGTAIVLPGDLPARLTVNSGLASVDVPARFGRSDNVYTTPGFDPAGGFLELEVSAGIGEVRVE
ncbi:MAG: hypothetical protein IT318_26835 [Anaerolineales bacterium]|nr:hypothetical protein [Anaerolineales bacterium]